MFRHTFALTLLMLLALLLVACGSNSFANSSLAKPAFFSCTFQQFSATVYRGPDQGLAAQGQLMMQIDQTGTIAGLLKQSNKPGIPVTGQANGRSINLIFDLGQSRLLFGVGTLQQDIHSCKGAAGGPLVGPRDADSGSWGTPSKPGGGGGGN